jgi:signal transduction histidine kinase
VAIRRGLASTGVRLALVQAMILIGAFAAAGSLTRIATRRVMRQDAEAHVTAEVGGLRAEYAAGGRPLLLASIQARSRRPGAFLYRLSDPRGAALAGDLPATAPRPGWSYIDGDAGPPAADPALNQDIVVYAQALPGGEVLAVGQAMGARERLRAELLRAMLWCGLVAGIGGLAASLAVYGGVVRRVDGLAAAARRAAQGQLEVRAPTRRRLLRDDIDDLAEAFNHMLDQIGVLMRNLRQVSADVAHDLRTPLTRVRHKLDRLRRAHAGDADLVAGIDSVGDDLAEALRTFDAVLRLAEIESAAGGPGGPVDLAELAARVVEAYRPDAEDGGHRLDADLQPAALAGDGDLLVQALANLLDNALRHTPPGTRILVRAGLDAGRPVLSVSDDGPGVPERHRQTVLQRFVRLEPSRSSDGAGLGLALVAAIARRHGARLDLFDAGPGLVVRLSFPAS